MLQQKGEKKIVITNKKVAVKKFKKLLSGISVDAIKKILKDLKKFNADKEYIYACIQEIKNRELNKAL